MATNPATSADMKGGVNTEGTVNSNLGPSGTAGAQTAAAAAAAQTAPSTVNTAVGTNGVLDTTNAATGTAIIDATLAQIPGLAQADPSGVFTAWVNSQIASYAGIGMAPSDISSTLQNVINNPGQNGSPQAQAIFDQLFPGYNQRIANGYTNTGPSGTGLAGYLAYNQQIQSMAQMAGLSPGTITSQQIGNAWAGDVSPSEMSDRITTGYTEALAAVQNVPGFADYMSSNYGVSLGDLASYYINPQNTELQLQQNFNAASTYGGAKAAGVDLTAAQSQSLSAFLSQSAGGGMSGAGVGQVNASTATGALASNISGAPVSAAQLIQDYQNVGGPTEQQVSTGQALGALEGNVGDVLAAQQAVGSRTAGAKGGGGYAQTAEGATGIGFAQS